MPTLGSVASVVASIRDESGVEIERIVKNADDEIRALKAPLPPEEILDRQQQIAAAMKGNEEALAQVEWDSRRRLIEQREEWIRRAVKLGNEILRGAGAGDLRRLALEALQFVRGEKVELLVSARDRERIDDEWCRSVAPNLSLAADAAPISGGCIARSGPITFDNSLEERARRLESQWRAALASIYRV
jgi:vacuolar-type H+-ATPase subunit E/Vma4